MTTDPYSPLVQDLVPLNEVRYAARDYPSIFDSLLRRLKIEYEGVYNDYATTTQAIMFIELMAYATAQLQWYLDRTASDCFLETARTRAAVARLVKQIGYKMGAASAASTAVTLTFPDGTTGPFTMPARWRYPGPDGLIYESYAAYNQAVALPAGGEISIPIRQGETRLLTYTSDGSKNQQYRMTSIDTERYLGDGTVDCWVDGLLWTEEEFLEFEKTNHYEVGYNDDPPLVQFGDGIAGNIPPTTAEVKVRFVIIDGEKGNVKANSITSSLDTLVIGGETVTFTVTNPVGASGGEGPEDPDRAKRLAPFSFAARGAAITEQDYEALSSSYTDATYGTVAKAFAFNPRSAYEDILFNDYVSDVELLLADNVVLMSALETAINSTATGLSTPIAGITSDLVDLEALRVLLSGDIGAASVQSTGAKGNATNAKSNATLSVSNCDDATSTLTTLRAYVVANVVGAVQTNIIKEIDDAQLSVGLAHDHAGTAKTAADTAVTALATVVDTFLDPSLILINEASPAPTMPSIITDIGADLATINAAVASLQLQIGVIVGDAQTLETNIEPSLLNMQTRIGELFDADCMSNYVQVPILSLDADGNYSAPSVGLIVGLQAYLTQIKEVTQHVEVIDGSSILVPAAIEILLEVNKDAYIEAEVVSDVVATVVGMTKGRNFNQPMYLSELYENVDDTSYGITRANIEITGPVLTPSVIDSDGNLVPASNQVITFGSLVITDKDGNELYSG